MEKDVEAKVAAALERRRNAITKLDLRKAEAEKTIAEREERKRAAKERWALAETEILAAVASLNDRLRDDGLQLEVGAMSEATAPALARLRIYLVDEKLPKSRDRYLTLNVSALGLVQPVPLGPHTLGKINEFDLSDASQGKFEQVLSEFVALVFAESANSNHQAR